VKFGGEFIYLNQAEAVLSLFISGDRDTPPSQRSRPGHHQRCSGIRSRQDGLHRSACIHARHYGIVIDRRIRLPFPGWRAALAFAELASPAVMRCSCMAELKKVSAEVMTHISKSRSSHSSSQASCDDQLERENDGLTAG
jgi:hypothetical protein